MHAERQHSERVSGVHGDLAMNPAHEQRWHEWLETIKQDIWTVFFWRATWLTVGDFVRSNPDIPPSHYFAYLARTYGTTQALAVRRLADEGANVVSLASLIKEVRRNAREITAEWWVKLQPGADIRDFRRFQAAESNHFDPAIATKDLARLKADVARVKVYVDQHLAHADRNPTKDIPTFGEIHAALDSVGDVFKTYYMLLVGADMLFLVPLPQPGWFQPFTVPWLKEGSPPPVLRGTVRGEPV